MTKVVALLLGLGGVAGVCICLWTYIELLEAETLFSKAAALMGTFMTPDWAAKPITVPYADFRNPQSLNLYTYVRNTPTTSFDADGHEIGDFLHRIWHGIMHSGCTILGGCETAAEESERRANDKAYYGIESKRWLIQHGYDAQVVSGMTNQQAIDAFGALNEGKEEFTSGGVTFKFVQQVVNLARLIPPGGVGRLTNAQVNDLAKWSGMKPVKDPPFDSHGQKVFQMGNRYFTPDVDSHIGGVWKEFDLRGNRMATLDVFLNKIGK